MCIPTFVDFFLFHFFFLCLFRFLFLFFLSFLLFPFPSFFFKVISCVGCNSLLLFCLFFLSLSLCTRLSLVLSFPFYFLPFSLVADPHGIFFFFFRSSVSFFQFPRLSIISNFFSSGYFFPGQRRHCYDTPLSPPTRYITLLTILLLYGR